ncbi:MAG TPA: hypothetical protein VFN97_03745 [Actinospica sp.]|nr:hypothetical protein [Actinospica sp.]
MAAWVLPLGAHLLRVDWVTLVVAWVGIASLLRVGRLLLDRLVSAGILLTGFLVGAGLLFSVWPWGLDPVPVGGCTLSAVVVGAVLSGRRPRLSRRCAPTDLLILGAAALSWSCLNAPTAGRSFAHKLPYLATREDMFNHYTLYDAIHRVGGYAFLNLGAVKPYMSPGLLNPTAMDFYPQGMHFLFALVDTFLRSSTDPGTAIGEYDRFALYNTAVLAILAAVLVWAARWIAGPALAGWRRVFVCVTVGGLAAVGQLTTLYWQAFAAHAAGLVVLVAAVAVCARPPRAAREQILLLGAVVVAATFIYNLTAVMVLGVTAIALLVHRRRIRPHWRFALLVGVPVVCMSLVPYVAELFAGFNASDKFLMWGSALRFSRVPLVVFALAGLTPLLTRNGRRSPVWRVATLSLVWCGALTALMCGYALLEVGTLTYYCEKLIEAVWVVSLACFGAVGLLLKPDLDLGLGIGRGLGRVRDLALGGLSAILAAVLVGVIPLVPTTMANGSPEQGVTWGAAWRDGFISSGFSIPLADLAKHRLLGDGVPTVVLFDDWGQTNWRVSMFNAALNHDRGVISDRAIDAIMNSNGLGTLKLSAAGTPASSADAASLANLEGLTTTAHVPLRFVVSNPDLARYLRAFGAADPHLRLTVVQIGGL